MQGVRFQNIPTDEGGEVSTTMERTLAPFSKYPLKIFGKIIIIFLVIMIIKKITFKKIHKWQYDREKEANEIKEQKAYEQRVRDSLVNAALTADFSIPGDPTNRPLIVYSYSETEASRANLLFFLEHAVHSQADFVFILNGKTDMDEVIPINIPNIRIVTRPNACYDLGSMGEVLAKDNYELVRKYKRFILMNSSIRGPFMPTWAENECWTDKYLGKVNETTKLVGMSYNCHPSRHVQSMIFATDSIGIRILLAGNKTDDTLKSDQDYDIPANPSSMNGLSICPSNKFRAVSSEISLTSLLYRASYRVHVLMTAAAVPDYYETCFHNGEPKEWEHVTPYETLFVKANRNIRFDINVLDKLTKFHDQWGYSSWKACAPKK